MNCNLLGYQNRSYKKKDGTQCTGVNVVLGMPQGACGEQGWRDGISIQSFWISGVTIADASFPAIPCPVSVEFGLGFQNRAVPYDIKAVEIDE